MSLDEQDEMSYLPGSGPSLEPQPYAYPYPPQAGFVTAFWNPYEVKHRRRTSRAQLAVLENEFDTDPKPNADKRRALASQLNMTPRAIQVWFQNRRAKIKAIKNKIPGGRGMPKLKPGEKAASRAARSALTKSSPDTDEEDDEKPSGSSGQWIQLEASPLASPTHPSPPNDHVPMAASPTSDGRTPTAPDSMPKPLFTIDIPPPDSSSAHTSAVSGPSSPDYLVPPSASSDFLAPPSPNTMLRRGSAPAPLQGIHRARYGAFHAPGPAPNPARTGELELGMAPVSPISPPDHQVAPMRRASLASHGRRPSLPDSHARLQSHPYYPHASGSLSHRRSGPLSPVPDVGQEQEQTGTMPYALSIPTMLPPAPSLQPGQNQAASNPSRMYRALPGAPYNQPTRQFSSGWTDPMHAPARPSAVPVAGPLPAADFSFGAPEPGHGDAFNRAMEQGSEMDAEFGHHPGHASNPEFHSHDYSHPAEFNPSSDFGSSGTSEFNTSPVTSGFAPPHPTWDARTRFGSMASIASDVTGVSVSSTLATSVSSGLGNAGFGDCMPDNQSGDPRAFDAPNNYRTGYNLGVGYPTGFQPDMRRASCPGEFLHQFSGMGMNAGSNERNNLGHMRPSPLGRSLTIAPDAQHTNPRGLTLNTDNGHRLALEAKSLRSPTFPPGQVDPTYPPPPPGPSVSDRGPFAPREQHQQSEYPQGMNPAQRSLVGGGFGSDPGYGEMISPGFSESSRDGGMGSSGKSSPMMFAPVGVEAGEHNAYLDGMNPDSLAMAVIGHEYAMPAPNEFAF